MGHEERLRELLGEGASSLDSARHTYVFRYRSAEHMIGTFRTYYGPVHKAFEALGADGGGALEADLKGLIQQWNTSADGTALLPSDYLEAVAVRR